MIIIIIRSSLSPLVLIHQQPLPDTLRPQFHNHVNSCPINERNSHGLSISRRHRVCCFGGVSCASNIACGSTKLCPQKRILNNEQEEQGLVNARTCLPTALEECLSYACRQWRQFASCGYDELHFCGEFPM